MQILGNARWIYQATDAIRPSRTSELRSKFFRFGFGEKCERRMFNTPMKAPLISRRFTSPCWLPKLNSSGKWDGKQCQ
jgi:hypothetical protein